MQSNITAYLAGLDPTNMQTDAKFKRKSLKPTQGDPSVLSPWVTEGSFPAEAK